jgi:EpsI family protein
MKRFDRNYTIIIVSFIVSAAISWQLYFKTYSQDDTVSIHDFPKTIDGWTSEELTITKREKAILETDNVFIRRYTNPQGKEVYLFIVYSQNNRKVSHPPEVCYTGSGASILSSVHDSFSSKEGGLEIRTNRLTLEQTKNNQILFYWFKVGNTFTPNYWKQQWLIACKSLLGKPSSSALIRISTHMLTDDDQQETQLLKDFGRSILPYLLKHLP